MQGAHLCVRTPAAQLSHGGSDDETARVPNRDSAGHGDGPSLRCGRLGTAQQRLLDSPASSALTQKRFGWQPTHLTLIADIEEGHYFRH
ncbi:hypothetical protein [Streptomyces sp. NBC_01620]|uniref:hypothetical protein n=1 Tax=unclassified Streptomyces TaxID=2593676 RepID=UPI00386D776B